MTVNVKPIGSRALGLFIISLSILDVTLLTSVVI